MFSLGSVFISDYVSCFMHKRKISKYNNNSGVNSINYGLIKAIRIRLNSVRLFYSFRSDTKEPSTWKR